MVIKELLEHLVYQFIQQVYQSRQLQKQIQNHMHLLYLINLVGVVSL